VAETTSRTLQQAIFFSLKEAKQAYPVGKFDYIGDRNEEPGHTGREGLA
jgi:hypothetical protein